MTFKKLKITTCFTTINDYKFQCDVQWKRIVVIRIFLNEFPVKWVHVRVHAKNVSDRLI